MTDSPKFNYIITIHNKEAMIEKVMMCVLMCCRDNSRIFPVIDGCTDRTEEIVLKICSEYSGVPITPVYTKNVHELLSINAGLKAAPQDGTAYNIILQDDVLLADFMLEKKVIALYQWGGKDLGYVSFRLGANFTPDAASSAAAVPYTDYVENAYGHGIQNAKVIYPGCFAYRSVPIKSPVCIPSKIVRTLGMYDERLAPYGHDDLEYSIRLIKAGYRNGVFALRFISDVEWGGTRTSPHPELNKIIQRNMGLIRKWRGNELTEISHSPQGSEIMKIPNIESENGQIAHAAWLKARTELNAFTGKSGVKGRIKSILQRVKLHTRK